MAAPQPIVIRGTRYGSCVEAAAELGVSPSLVHYYKRKNKLDDIGLLPPVHEGGSKRVTIRGVTYDSYREAAEALGVTTAAVSKAARRGTLDTLGERSIFS